MLKVQTKVISQTNSVVTIIGKIIWYDIRENGISVLNYINKNQWKLFRGNKILELNHFWNLNLSRSKVHPRRDMIYKTPKSPTQTTQPTSYKIIEFKSLKDILYHKTFDRK